MDWKIGLDKYLTASPYDDGFEDWSEDVCNLFTDEFYNANEDWINESDGKYNKWLNKLFDNRRSVIESQKIIERAFSIYKLKTLE